MLLTEQRTDHFFLTEDSRSIKNKLAAEEQAGL